MSGYLSVRPGGRRPAEPAPTGPRGSRRRPCWSCPGCSSAAAPAPTGSATTSSAPKSGYLVYWDQDEEVDYYSSADGSQGQLMAPWDLNGQTCVLNDGSGRFVGGSDPTNPSQLNPGGPPNYPFKQPPDSEEMNNVHGGFTGQDALRPGALPHGTGPAGSGCTGGRHRGLQRPVHVHRVRHRRGAQHLRQRHRDGPGLVPDPHRRSPDRVVRAVLHQRLHPLRTRRRGGRAEPHRRHGRTLPAGHDDRPAERQHPGPPGRFGLGRIPR